jgi:hypothetical protein
LRLLEKGLNYLEGLQEDSVDLFHVFVLKKEIKVLASRGEFEEKRFIERLET